MARLTYAEISFFFTIVIIIKIVLIYSSANLVCGGLAQLGEHLPYKQRVSGSSPLTSTIIFCRLSSIGRATDL